MLFLLLEKFDCRRRDFAFFRYKFRLVLFGIIWICYLPNEIEKAFEIQ